MLTFFTLVVLGIIATVVAIGHGFAYNPQHEKALYASTIAYLCLFFCWSDLAHPIVTDAGTGVIVGEGHWKGLTSVKAPHAPPFDCVYDGVVHANDNVAVQKHTNPITGWSGYRCYKVEVPNVTPSQTPDKPLGQTNDG